MEQTKGDQEHQHKATSYDYSPWIPPFKSVEGSISDSNGQRVCDMRGWGFLIDVIGLVPEKAAETQDAMAERIAGLMNNSNCTSDLTEELKNALHAMYLATRDYHRGKLPLQMQIAYEAAGRLLFGNSKSKELSAASDGSIARSISCKCGGTLTRISEHPDNRFRCEFCRDVFRYENGEFILIRKSED